MNTAESTKNKSSRREARARQVKPEGEGWGTTAFGLLFVAVGLGVLLFGVAPQVYDWARMQRWQPVQATLLSAHLSTSSSRKSTTYGVSASYRYQLAGQSYQGQRVAISGGHDNIGDFQQVLGHALVAAYREGRTVPAWVNPSNAHEAVLDRSLRPGLLVFQGVFVLVFGGVGLGVLYFRARVRRAALARVTAAAQAGSQTLSQPAVRPPSAKAIAARAEVEATCGLQRTPGGVRMVLPAGRGWKPTMMFAAVGAFFLGIVMLFGSEMPLGLAIIFGGISGAMVVGCFYALANSLTVELDARGVRTERRLCGLMLIHQQAPASDIRRVREAVSYTVQTGARQDTFYRLEVELHSGRKLTIADNLRGRQAAEALLASITAQTGYPR